MLPYSVPPTESLPSLSLILLLRYLDMLCYVPDPSGHMERCLEEEMALSDSSFLQSYSGHSGGFL